MSLMNDSWIREQAEKGMITPFVEKQCSDNIVSYGLSSYGYDARLADEFWVFTNIHTQILDPKNFSEDAFVKVQGATYIIPPHSFVLARTMEYFDLPEDVFVLCIGKSTYARCGIIVNVTPLEPGWKGYVTLELSNTTSLPTKIYAYEGICQFVFLCGEKPTLSYSQRKGKYMDQQHITLPKI